MTHQSLPEDGGRRLTAGPALQLHPRSAVNGDAAVERIQGLNVGGHLHNQLMDEGEHLPVAVDCTDVLAAVGDSQQGNVQRDPLPRQVVHIWVRQKRATFLDICGWSGLIIHN